MKTMTFSVLTVMILASSAAAGGITFNLPNLDFPPRDTVIVGKDCALPDAIAGQCTAEK